MKENNNIYDRNIISLANYIAQLYYKTDCKYRCTRRKIDGLLAIYKFCCMNNNVCDCFDDFYYLYSDSEKSNSYNFPIICRFFFSDICIGRVEENNEPIQDKINNFKDYPPLYKNKFKLTHLSSSLITEIFQKFGNYTDKSLFIMIVSIKEGLDNLTKENVIDFFSDKKNLLIYKDNEIFNFIKNKQIISKEKTYCINLKNKIN